MKLVIQIKTCRMTRLEESQDVQKRNRVSDLVEDVNVFVFNKQFKKTQSKSSDISNLWICNTYLFTKGSFPNITRELEVDRTIEVTQILFDQFF